MTYLNFFLKIFKPSACLFVLSAFVLSACNDGDGSGGGGGGTTPPNTPSRLIAWQNTCNTSNTANTIGTAISSVSGLKAIADGLTGEYHLTTNIDVSSEANWNAIGGTTDGATNIFTGTLHGNCHAIVGLSINTTDSYQGLFSQLGTGTTISNLGIGVTKITANAAVGALAGYATATSTSPTTLTNIAVAPMDTTTTKTIEATGTVTITELTTTEYGYAGGVLGAINTDVSLLSATNDNVAVFSSDSSLGGLVGYNKGTAIGSSSGDVSSNSGSNLGGLVGYNTGTIIGSSSGDVSSNSGSSLGGLVGINLSGTIIGSASGNISSGSNNTGGLVGQAVNNNTTGFALGWISSLSTNTASAFGCGIGFNASGTANTYCGRETDSEGDHVGNTDGDGSTARNDNDATSNTWSVRITGLANAGTMSDKNTPTAGKLPACSANPTFDSTKPCFVFESGKWPRILLPEELNNYPDLTIPAQPAGYKD